MTEAGDPAIEALISAARADFARGLVAKAAALEAFVAGEAWDDAKRAAHKLRGSAGVYGFAAIGAAAAVMDDLLSSAARAPDAAERATIREALCELRREAERSPGEPR
jgi:HPt (histidine-containing phosphotransfer) domain-containing protein